MEDNSTATAPEPTARGHPFDAAAPRYDAAFTDTQLGRWYRELVWDRMEEAFQAGDHVLELGCGTGEDALWLAQRGVRITATDVSDSMLDAARQKATASHLDKLISFVRLDLTTIDSRPLPILGEGPGVRAVYDGAYSNFGPLNCLADRRSLARALADSIRAGGKLVLVVMGPICPWEIVWHLGHLEFRTAFRRFRSGAPARIHHGGSIPVWYPAIHRLEREFKPYFRVVKRFGLGLLMPPTAMAGLIDRAPRLFDKLATIDKHAGWLWPWLWLNDHYLVVLERRRS